jgi:hypothetical protein
MDAIIYQSAKAKKKSPFAFRGCISAHTAILKNGAALITEFNYTNPSTWCILKHIAPVNQVQPEAQHKTLIDTRVINVPKLHLIKPFRHAPVR